MNRGLDSFNRCVATLIAWFPFYAERDEDRCEEVAEELRGLVSGIDETTVVHNGFWESFCDDVAIGDSAEQDARAGTVPPGSVSRPGSDPGQ